MSAFSNFLHKIKPTPKGVLVLFFLIVLWPLLVDLMIPANKLTKGGHSFSFLQFSLSGFAIIGLLTLFYLFYVFLREQLWKEIRKKLPDNK